jgi:hypothetical protein
VPSHPLAPPGCEDLTDLDPCRYKFAYVKTLTNLTDLAGPEDGGTLVIRGSHKLGPDVRHACAFSTLNFIHCINFSGALLRGRCMHSRSVCEGL